MSHLSPRPDQSTTAEVSLLTALNNLAATPTGSAIVKNSNNTFSNSALGTGTVTSVSVASVNGVSGSVATATTTPQITITLGTLTAGTWHANPITELYGGTNQTSYAVGDLLYASAANTLSKLTGNITTTQKFLSQTGTGSASQAPSWQTLSNQGTLAFYLHSTASAIGGGYLQQLVAPQAGKVDLQTVGVNTTRVLYNFATDAGYPGLSFIPAGQFMFHVHAKSTVPSTGDIYAEFWETDAAGTDIALIGTSESTASWGGLSTSETEYILTFVTANVYTMTSTASRLVCRVWFLRTSGTHTVDIYVGGTADSHILLPSNTVDVTNFVPYSGATTTLALGAHDITMSGSLGTTGARLTKGWFTDLQVTNSIAGSITGNAASATYSAGSTIADDTTTAANMYPTWVTANTGNLPIKVSSTKIYFVPSTGILTSTGFSGPLTGSVTGSVSGNAGSATYASAVTIADDTTTVATMYPTWVTANTGNLAIKVSSSKISFVPSTGVLTAVGFSGPITGNVTGNVSGSSGSCTGNAATVSGATFTTNLTVNGGTLTLTANVANTSVLTIGAGAVSVSGANTGDVTLSSPNHGLGLTNQVITLGTPSTCTAATTNTVTTTTHTHAITGFLTAEADTLATVTGRGATTSIAVTFEGNATLGKATGTTGLLNFKGTTSGTVGLTVSADAGTWTLTLPTTAGSAGKVVMSNGTTWIYSTPTYPSASATSGKILISDGTNFIASTPTFPNASATSLKIIRSDGTNWIASTATISDSPSTAGKLLVSDGTNWITSTPTFPNASATSGKIIKSDGTNWLASTETYAAPSTSGNVLTSDGTNWTSTAPVVTASNTLTFTNKSIQITASPTTQTATGDVVSLTYGESITLGDLLYYKNDSKVYKADATAISTGKYPCLYLALATAASGANLVLARGIYKDSTKWTGGTVLTVGGLCYASATAGGTTQTQPSSTDNIIQIIGVAIATDTIDFNPSKDFITHT